jgi:hypothetical protein
MGCQKDNAVSLGQSIHPSVSKQVLELKGQKTDFQHITAQYLQETAQPITTPNSSAARFVITYFSDLGGEHDTTFSETQLLSALQSVGLNDKAARSRTNLLFQTDQCSPLFLTETAQLIAPSLPRHTEGTFICELFKPYDGTQSETVGEIVMPNSPNKVLLKKRNMMNGIKTVNKLVGVSGSVATYGDSYIKLYFNEQTVSEPTMHRLETQEVRRILQTIRGYTEGEAVYLKLILGTLTEQETWWLFANEIVPEWQKTNNTPIEARFARLSFRYNYVEILGEIGRVGFTIYDLDGFTDSMTAF